MEIALSKNKNKIKRCKPNLTHFLNFKFLKSYKNYFVKNLANKIKFFNYLSLFALFLFCPCVFSQIIADGTTGQQATLKGPDYLISSDLGKISGKNLFHSFSQFDINTNESATFTGPSNISNIISRVTGNQSSFIDGLLRSEINGADFYFINPNGIMFGPNASLDIGGSFYVSTADYIKMQDKTLFHAKNPESSFFTSAPPEAFGFLGTNIGEVSLKGNHIAVNDGKEINIFSGNLKMEDASLYAPSGKINLISVGSEGEIIKDNKANVWKADGFSKLGDIDLKKNEDYSDIQKKKGILDIDVSSSKQNNKLAGKIFIAGNDIKLSNFFIYMSLADEINNNLEKSGYINIISNNLSLLEGSGIYSDNYSAVDAGNIDIQTTETLTLNGEKNNYPSVISSLAYSFGNSANVNINAGKILISNGARIETVSYDYGESGNININSADSILIYDKSSSGQKSGIFSTVFASGTAGDINISTKDLYLKPGIIQSLTLGSESFGNAGNIQLNVNNIKLENGSQIFNSTYGKGDAGEIKINAKQGIIASGIDQKGYSSGILATTYSEGNGGKIDINTLQIFLLDGARISVTASDLGASGNINIISDKIFISGIASNKKHSAISATTVSDGNGGSIDIQSKDIEIIQGFIHSQTEGGNGNGGDINIVSDSLNIIKGGEIAVSTTGQGKAGNITIDVKNDIIIKERGDNGEYGGIFANTLTLGDAGSLDIKSKKLEIDDGIIQAVSAKGSFGDAGNIIIATENLMLKNGSLIGCSTSGEGNAGFIKIYVKDIFNLSGINKDGYHSSVMSDTYSSGNGGNLLINSENIIMNNAFIQVASHGKYGKYAGNAGTIYIIAQNVDIFNDSQISAATKSSGNSGTIDIKSTKLEISTGGLISVFSLNQGKAGNIFLNIKDGLLIKNGEVSATANYSSGGDIYIETDKLQLTDNADISSTVFGGEGGGGNVSVNSDSIVVLDGSSFTARADKGKGGNISVDSLVFLREGELKDVLNASSNVIGNDGTVRVNSPEMDISGAIAILPEFFLDVSGLMANPCSAKSKKDMSSLVVEKCGNLLFTPFNLF